MATIAFVRLLRRFAGDRRGTALIDFAFAAPVLVLILLGCFEVTRYILLHQKLDRAAASTADLVAQQENITAAQIADLMDAARRLMEPYDLGANGRVVISQVHWPVANNPAKVEWQEKSPTGIAATSKVGLVGNTATLPTGFTVQTDDAVVVAEVYYNYEPLFLPDLFGPSQLYHNAYNRPRN